MEENKEEVPQSQIGYLETWIKGKKCFKRKPGRNLNSSEARIRKDTTKYIYNLSRNFSPQYLKIEQVQNVSKFPQKDSYKTQGYSL